MTPSHGDHTGSFAHGCTLDKSSEEVHKALAVNSSRFYKIHTTLLHFQNMWALSSLFICLRDFLRSLDCHRPMAFDVTVAPMLMKNITTTQRRPPTKFFSVESANKELRHKSVSRSTPDSRRARYLGKTYLINAGLTARARHKENWTKPFVEARAAGGAYRLMRSMLNLKRTPCA